jgi:hypothetical protein
VFQKVLTSYIPNGNIPKSISKANKGGNSSGEGCPPVRSDSPLSPFYRLSHHVVGYIELYSQARLTASSYFNNIPESPER